MTKKIHVGFDLSITEQLGAEADARVYVEAQHGEVRIVGPFDDWAGYKVVREYDTQEQAEALALDIARNPIAEFDRLGYDHVAWFTPTNACPSSPARGLQERPRDAAASRRKGI